MLNRGELEDRFDAQFYKEIVSFLGFKKLGRYVWVKGGKRIPKDYYYSTEPTDYKYLRVTNIDDNGYFDFEKLNYISEEVFKILERYEIEKDNLFISIAGTVGKVGVIENDLPKRTVLTENCAKIVLRDSSVLPYFLKCVLNTKFVQNQIENQYIQTTIPKLGLERIFNLKIPAVPSIERQGEIVGHLKQATNLKKAKEAEAREKLASVDNLVLDALGITLPEPEANTLAKRIFFTKSSDVSSGRFDAAIHQKKFSLHSKIFPMAKLKDVYAINPRTSFDHLKPETLLSFVPMEAISDKMGRITKQYEREIKESKGYTAFQENDVLWAKITPCMQNGKSVVATNLLDGLGFGSTEYHVFRALSNNANPFYLHSILRLKSLREAAMNYFGGSAGHQRVDVDFFKNLQIPIPPPEVQTEIAERVEAIYAEAKKLKDEAAEILRRAKTEVERMILDES